MLDVLFLWASVKLLHLSCICLDHELGSLDKQEVIKRPSPLCVSKF